jgi:hypothetical protein
LVSGTIFTRVSVSLRQPDVILNNATNLTIDQLLSSTRYISFYFYGGFEQIPKTFTVYVDDIQLTGQTAAAVTDWSVY